MKIDFNDYAPGIQALMAAINNKKPTADTLRDIVREVVEKFADGFIESTLLPSALSNPDVREEFIDELREQYKLRHGVQMPVGEMISEGYEPWLKKAVAEGTVTFDGYKEYRNRLAAAGFTDASLRNIDAISDDILDHMGNPKSDMAFKTFGLLMGDVQSGKTATFTAITHKAVDAGYRLIVVLTGTKSSLRAQTQNRLNADLIGQAVSSKGVRARTITSGKVMWNCLTSSEHDFTKAKSDAHISPDVPNQVSIAVMQKNGKVLANFSKWLEDSERLGVKNLPIFFVDDEADQASINVNRKEEDPTRINGLIREILGKFDRSAYLAVTATPFANVFIDPNIDLAMGQTRKDELPQDLFPRDYIYAIPAPKGYLGVERLFGDFGEIEKDAFKYRAVIPMMPGDEGDPDGIEEKTYEGRFKATDELRVLPDSLRKAVLYFLCVLTIKDLTSISKSNSSMLVHIVRYRNVQKELRRLIDELVSEVQTYAEAENGRITEATEENELFCQLESLWDEGCREERWYEDPTHGEEPPSPKKITGHAWREVWKSRFRSAIRGVKVIEANMNSKVKNFATYYENNDAKLIAVGGDALSRGLTLEGLCVSYFSRRSSTYDTLLQMGRWFGYREGMRDYMKLWISDVMVDAYGYIADALTEFRDLIGEMKMRGMTPKQFGLKIRVAPKHAKLMVTASNKRRTTQRTTVVVDVTGRPFQASTFPREIDLRRNNADMVSSFLQDLGEPSGQYGRAAQGDSSIGAKDLVWEDVPADAVAQLLTDFHCPSWSDDLEVGPVAKKIRERNEGWMVRVVSIGNEKGERFEDDVFGLGDANRVVCSERTIVDRGNRLQQANRGILGSVDFGRHWTAERKEKLRREIFSKPGQEEGELRSVHFLQQPGEPPQLLIFPIRPVREHSEEKLEKYRKGRFELWREPETLVTLAFALPGTGEVDKDRAKLTYETNIIYQLFGDGDAEDEE